MAAGVLDESSIRTLGARAEAMINELAEVSAEPGRLVRLFLTPEHRRAAEVVSGWMGKAGMQVFEDALGTVRGRMPTAAARRLLIGSHIDTVIDAGKYDGPLGVIAGILAAEHFARRDQQLPFGIDVLAFGDEEGSRFPSAFSTSAAVAGVFDRAMLKFADGKGVTFADALAAYHKNPADIGPLYQPGEALAYIEVHIEQGPVLEAEKRPLGVVTGIVGQHRMRVTVTGQAGHAGTVPIKLRQDALVGAAEMVMAVETLARGHESDGMVATVGRIEAFPGAVNVIPGRVEFTVDLRSMTDALRRAAMLRIETQARRIAIARKLKADFETIHDAPTTPCAPALQDELAAAISDLGLTPVRLPSGAGHDGQMMAKLCPIGMLFVRCRGGISHNPAEYASPQDMGYAIAALIRFIERFDPERAVSA
jgi:allantoate deiminase